MQLVERMLGDNRTIVFLPELAYAYSLAYLAIGDEEEALKRLAALAEKARNHEPDQGYINVMNLRMNFLADPRIEEPRFAAVLSRIRGD